MHVNGLSEQEVHLYNHKHRCHGKSNALVVEVDHGGPYDEDEE